ncbi:hypothetical protein yfred0001_31220 [Yersinia frederiksenii ATCC 33641]|nr:hypothetical protein yfred0001_31220 [Yersinia frederiksenii ATCC 33641]
MSVEIVSLLINLFTDSPLAIFTTTELNILLNKIGRDK